MIQKDCRTKKYHVKTIVCTKLANGKETAKGKSVGSNFPNYSVKIAKTVHCLFFNHRVLYHFSHKYACKIIEDDTRTKRNCVKVMIYNKLTRNTKKEFQILFFVVLQLNKLSFCYVSRGKVSFCHISIMILHFF